MNSQLAGLGSTCQTLCFTECALDLYKKATLFLGPLSFRLDQQVRLFKLVPGVARPLYAGAVRAVTLTSTNSSLEFVDLDLVVDGPVLGLG